MTRLLKGRIYFLQSIIVSITVSNLGKRHCVCSAWSYKVDSFYYCDVVPNQGLLPDMQKLMVKTSLFNSMVCQLIVHNKQLRFCVYMCKKLWNQKIGRGIAHRLKSSGLCWSVVVAFKTLSTWKKSCKPARSRLVKRYRSRYRTVLQNIVARCCNREDTLSTALTTVFGATSTLSYLRVLL